MRDCANSPQAVVLIVLLSLDLLLDALCVVRMRKKWFAWALFLRLVLAIGYLAIFMAYIALKRAFPVGFTCWGMATDYSNPVVYLFLWLIGFVSSK
jgi:hypothetical protein